jgi:hypothetical protein
VVLLLLLLLLLLQVQDITWPPLRPADFNVTSLWALLLAALLLLTPLLG